MSLKRQIATGAAWLIFGRFLVRLIGLTSTIILARLLAPEDFGLIALAMSVVALLDFMSAFSFDLALIADQDSGRADYDTAWSLSILKGGICAGGLLLAAEPAAAYFDDRRLAPIFDVLALFILLRGFENIGIVDFRKQLAFDKDFRFNVYLKLAGFVVTISAAFILRDYRALLLGIVIQALVRVMLSYGMSPYRPRWDLSRWRPIMGFSKWLLVNNLLIFLNQRSTTFILGKVVGMRATGLFSMAEEIGNLITTELVWPVQRAVFPGYAKVSDDPVRLRSGYLDVLTVVMTLGLPVAVGLACSAEQFVKLFLGENWLEIVPLISLMAMAGAISLCCANAGAIFIAMGRTSLIAIIAALMALVRLPALVYAIINYQAIGAAYVLISSALFALLLNWLAVAKILNFSPMTLVKHVWRAPLAAAIMGLTLLGLESRMEDKLGIFDNVLQLMTLILSGGLVYTALILVMWQVCRKPDGAEAYISLFLANGFSQFQNVVARR
ncbi:MAG: lipopolysaccharide biosynthesis protein [Geminicoccaceae bacterium]